MANDELYQFIKDKWRQGDSCEWEVCLAAAQVVGNRDGGTARIASENHVTEDSVERRARAGRAFYELEKLYPDDSAGLRKQLRWRYFEAVGRAVEQQLMDWQTAHEYLMDAAQDGLRIEQFRALLPAQNEKSFLRTCLKYFKHLDNDLIHAPYLGVEEKYGVMVSQAALILRDALSDLIEATKKNE